MPEGEQGLTKQYTTLSLYADMMESVGNLPENETELPYRFSFPPEIYDTLERMYHSGATRRKGELTWTVVGFEAGGNYLRVTPIEEGKDYSATLRSTISAVIGVQPMFLMAHTQPRAPLPHSPGFSRADIKQMVRFNRLAYMFVVIDQYGCAVLAQTKESMGLHFSTTIRGRRLSSQLYASFKGALEKAASAVTFKRWEDQDRLDDDTVKVIYRGYHSIFANYGYGYYVAEKSQSASQGFNNNFIKAKYI